jgi:hypothetical protein
MRRVLAAFIVGLSLLTPVALPAPAFQTLAAQEQRKAQIVYITRTGKKYHREGCRYLSHSKIAITLEDAKNNRYTPCSVCHPPE